MSCKFVPVADGQMRANAGKWELLLTRKEILFCFVKTCTWPAEVHLCCRNRALGAQVSKVPPITPPALLSLLELSCRLTTPLPASSFSLCFLFLLFPRFLSCILQKLALPLPSVIRDGGEDSSCILLHLFSARLFLEALSLSLSFFQFCSWIRAWRDTR